MRRRSLLPLAAPALLAVAAALFLRGPSAPVSAEPLLVYCGAGIRVPVEEAARGYERETGVRIELNYGGSQSLLAGAEASRKGDLLIPGDDSYLRLGREKGLVAETVPVARMAPVFAVRKGNPKGIRAPDAPGIRLALPNPEATAVGKLVKSAFEKAGRWEAVKAAAAVQKPSVPEVANDLKLGMVDAGFVWDATVLQYPELERVELPELEGSAANLSAGVLESAPLPAAALRFARWLAAAKGAFERAGFRPAEGDAWTPEPRLLFHAGAMLRPAIEKTVAAFERREGCRVDMVYNGCGILVAQMKAGDRPDLYFSCDEQFMKQVQDLFERPVAVSLNQLVVLVKKGNPFGVRGLEDLGKPGLRVGIGHEQQCALGVITQETLLQSKLRDRVMRNVVVQVPAGDMLVNQMKAGTLDAVVAYVSNAAGSGDVLEALPVDLPCALAVQPLAVGRASRYPHLAGRLAEALRTPGSRRRFEQEGFRWKAAP